MDAETIELTNKSCKGYDVTNKIPIRTLFVGPIKADMSDQIKCYFEQFGAVSSVEIEQEDNGDTHCGLVEFKTVEAAKTLLSSNETHLIDGCNVQVKVAEPWHQPDHILNALDDDCLQMIFSKLKLKDLTNAANVCVRFNEQAKSVFSSKFRKLNLTNCSPENAKYLLKTFGSLAQSIDVESKYSTVRKGGYEIEILTMIAQCCTSKLKELTINAFGFEEQLPDDVTFDTALSKLEILSLNDCYLQNGLANLVSACGELKVLYIDCCSQFASVTSDRCFPKFDKLEELYLNDMAGLSGHFLNRIIALNAALKVLSMVGSVHPDIEISNILDTIVQKVPNLLELEFNVSIVRTHTVIFNNVLLHNIQTNLGFAKILRCLVALASLKVLKLNLNERSAAELSSILIKNGIPIEHMQLSNGIIDSKTIANIAQMKRLKILELFEFDGLTDEHMIQLASGLGSKLEKLHLEGSTAKNLTTIGLKKMLPFVTKLSLLTLKSTTIRIDADDYKTLLAMIQKRPEEDALLIELTGAGGQVDVDEAVLLQNHDAFYIDEKNGVKEVTYYPSIIPTSNDSDDDFDDNDGYRTPYSSDSD